MARCVLPILITVCSQSLAHEGEVFTVSTEIGLSHFGYPYGPGTSEAVQLSPNGKYVAVVTERGRLDVNELEDALRVYRYEDLRQYVRHPEGHKSPRPVWTLIRAADADGPIIWRWRWLGDSNSIVYLERSVSRSVRLALADVRSKKLQMLTPVDRVVRAYDIRDVNHYVYVLQSPDAKRRAIAEQKAPLIVGAGRSLSDLMLPINQYPAAANWTDRGELWAVVGGHRFPVTESMSGKQVVLFMKGQAQMALSPNGEDLVTALPVLDVPADWEARFQPPAAASPWRVRAGRQDLSASSGWRFVSQYVAITLRDGKVQTLADAPTSGDAGWESAQATPAWADDGTTILLPGTFLAEAQGDNRPCVAVVNVISGERACVEILNGQGNAGYQDSQHSVVDVRFVNGDRARVLVSYKTLDGMRRATEYRHTSQAQWALSQDYVEALADPANADLRVAVKQGLNDSPVLVAIDRHTGFARTILDPNPQLEKVDLGLADVFTWKDGNGRKWTGGLFKPPGYSVGRRYPLVIQTHGFVADQFRPSGLFPTAFAARALAGAGILVLQIADTTCSYSSSVDEGPCNVAGYEAAINQLVGDGFADSDRVGVVGFSRTCFYVMEVLTTSALHIEAASITDGVMEDYIQYMTTLDFGGSAIAFESDAMIGARPFGEGLQLWMQRSPLFNVDRVTAALLVIAAGKVGVPFMWGPYAAMRYLRKPVEFHLLNTDEHVLTNPAVRLASQGGTVDWFRFWLQGYEDPANEKAEQYRRWEKLCDLQRAQLPSRPGFCVPSDVH